MSIPNSTALTALMLTVSLAAADECILTESANLPVIEVPAGSIEPGNEFALSNDGSMLAVGDQEDGVEGSGSVFVYARDGDAWVVEAMVKGPDPRLADRFGNAVALSADGETMLVGCFLDDDEGDNAGSAFVYVRQRGAWALDEQLVPGDIAANDQFGASVALSHDGQTALVGSMFDDFAERDSGSAYVFVRDGAGWSVEAKIPSPAPEASGQFGYCVDLDATGALAAISAPFNDAVFFQSGVIYIYERIDEEGWSQQAVLTPAPASGLFGTTLRLAANGTALAAGAPIEVHDPIFVAGSLYIFERDGAAWTQAARFTEGGFIEAPLALSVDISDAGDRVVAGRIFFNPPICLPDLCDPEMNNLAYTRGPDGWAPDVRLVPGDPDRLTLFGHPVAISGDGLQAAVAGFEDFPDMVPMMFTLNECAKVAGDLDGDGAVDAADLIALLGQWGPCGDCATCSADLDDDCIVGTPDLLILLGNWG